MRIFRGTVIALCLGALCAQAADFDGYEVSEGKDHVTYVRSDGSATATLRLIAPELTLSTTKAYAQHVMDSYQGWDLKPVIDLRGFSFKYVDNAPCSGLLTYYDGRSYLLFQACGQIEQAELTGLFQDAGAKLRLSETLKKQSRPTLY